MSGKKTSVESADREAALGREALSRGDRPAARRHAFRALKNDPRSEFGWLLLAALAPRQARRGYLGRVLEINPENSSAREALRELDREAGGGRPAAATQPIVPTPRPPVHKIAGQRKSRRGLSWTHGILLAGMALAFALAGGAALSAYAAGGTQDPVVFANLQKDPGTATPTPTATPTRTVTPRPTPTSTPSPTPRRVVVWTPAPAVVNAQPAGNTSAVGTRWIDVDLSTQTVVAYQGNTPVARFLVSTGVAAHPTVTGQYRIYVKYRYDDMAGPDYYLPNVPYVMYFYEGYSLHGTYWHHNFGHPMSHGCVNMYTPDAAWLYNWASVGTLVNIHY